MTTIVWKLFVASVPLVAGIVGFSTAAFCQIYSMETFGEGV